MQATTKLEEVLKEFKKEVTDTEFKHGERVNQITALEAKRKLLEADVKALEEKRGDLDTKVKEEKKIQILEIEESQRQVKALQESLEKERNRLSYAVVEANNEKVRFTQKTAEAESARLDYQEKTNQINEKLAKLQAMQATIV